MTVAASAVFACCSVEQRHETLEGDALRPEDGLAPFYAALFTGLLIMGAAYLRRRRKRAAA